MLARSFPGSKHVDHVRLRGRSDADVWDLAGREGYAIVPKDSDFRELSFLHGAPPKVVWLRVDDAGTDEIAEIVFAARARIERFDRDSEESLLELFR